MYRFTPKFALRSAAFSASAAAIVCLSGCAGISGTAVPSSLTTSIPAGALHGGQQPIEGARVFVFAAGTTGYGSAATSLILVGAPGVQMDPSGNGYVTTDASGGFSYAGTVTCPTPTSQIYILATGGNTTGHQDAGDNGALALSAALGSCSTINSSTFTSINEVTTAAMVFALNAFTIDGAHIGSTATNPAGLVNAFAAVANLVDNTTGTALAVTPSGHGVAPQTTLNTLANIIAPCANSGGPTSAGCTSLFSHASGSNGTPTTTIGALLNIATQPAAQAAALYTDALATAPFHPALTAAPNDFSLGITFSPTGFTTVQPGAVVIDAAGFIYMANCQSCLNPSTPDSLVVYSPNGSFLHSFTGSAVPGTQVLHQIKGIAFDASGANVYTINQGISGGPSPGIGDDQLIKMDTATGTVQAGFPVDFNPGTYGSDSFQGIALDNSGEIWATATNSGAIVEVTPSGNLINGSPFFVGATVGVAADIIGNIWFAGIGGNNIIEFDTNGNFNNNYTTAGLNQPLGIAINASNEIWTVDNGSNQLSKIEFFNGANGSGSPYSLGLYQAAITAIDGTNQVLIPNCRAGCLGSGSSAPDGILRINQSGVPNDGGVSTSATLTVPGLNGAGGAAIDAAGNVWVSNAQDGTLTQAIGLASPTIQPLALASTNGTIGQLP